MAKNIKTINQNVFLYQWVNYDQDYYDVKNLGRLGGNGAAANRFRAIEFDAKMKPDKPQWIIAARRKDNEWGVIAILRVRYPTMDELSLKGVFEKYLYIDQDASVLLATPESPAIVDSVVSESLNKAIGKNTRGENGKQFSIPTSVLVKLKSLGKVSLRTRVEELQGSEPIMPITKNEVLIASEKDSFDLSQTISDFDSVGGETGGCEEVILSDLNNAAECLISEYEGIAGEDVDAIAKRRIGQGPFRRLLEKQCGAKCFLSDITKRELLIASHITPWSKSGRSDKVNPNNGLLLSVSWDSVFDKGLVTFGENGDVVFSPELDDVSAKVLGISKDARIPEQMMNDERRFYLKYHREKIFKGVDKSLT